MVFRQLTDPDAAVIADVMIRTGSISDAQYARLLSAANRQYAPSTITCAVAFDAFATFVHIGHKPHPFEQLILQAYDSAEALP